MVVSLFSGMTLAVSAEEPVDTAQMEAASNDESVLNALAEDEPADGANNVQAADKQYDFENGVLSTDMKVSHTTLGKLLGITHSVKEYLTVSGDAIAVSSDKGAEASFLLHK